ncbi:hypothetical protein [Rickettsia endosymbiont of Nabis limbatus]|uniref:hypothetical protein n=1 Tax=Rickettsia endosymbiont of Nabis limbatus TaxID=3066268 RepID=UPI003AF3945F
MQKPLWHFDAEYMTASFIINCFLFLVLVFNQASIYDGALIDLVFANLTIKPQKLDYTLCSPFDVFVKIPKNGEWWRQRESNP